MTRWLIGPAILLAVWRGVPEEPPCVEHRATAEMAAAIRRGCGFVHNGTLCTYDGCFRHPGIVRIGPLGHRTFTDSISNRTLPAFVTVEHVVSPGVWGLYNATGVRAVECFVIHRRIFGAMHPTQ